MEVLLRGDNFPPPPPTAAAAGNTTDGGEAMNGSPKNASKFDHGDGGLNTSNFYPGGRNTSNFDSGAEKTGAASKDRLLDASCDRTGVSWQDLAGPAARVWAACRPCDPSQLRAIDAIFGDIFRVRQ